MQLKSLHKGIKSNANELLKGVFAVGGNMKINQKIINAILTIVNHGIQTAPFDRTIKGKILKNNGDNTYDVLINNITYSKIKYTNSTLSIMSNVWIRVPQNNLSDAYIDRQM